MPFQNIAGFRHRQSSIRDNFNVSREHGFPLQLWTNASQVLLDSESLTIINYSLSEKVMSAWTNHLEGGKYRRNDELGIIDDDIFTRVRSLI